MSIRVISKVFTQQPVRFDVALVMQMDNKPAARKVEKLRHMQDCMALHGITLPAGKRRRSIAFRACVRACVMWLAEGIYPCTGNRN